MDKEFVSGIVQEMENFSESWPEPVQKRLQQVRSILSSYSAEQFERKTDGTVTKPATESKVSADDPALAVNRLYAALSDYAGENRNEKNELLESLVNRLGAQVDTYERDFP